MPVNTKTSGLEQLYRQFLPAGGLVALKTQYMRWQQIAALGETKDIP